MRGSPAPEEVPRSMSPVYGYAAAALGAASSSVRYPMSRSATLDNPPGKSIQNSDHLIAQLASAGYPVTSVLDLERLFAPDPYEEVLIVMAEVRAYWQGTVSIL